MALKQVLIAVGAVLMGLGLLDLAGDGALGSWAIAIAALPNPFAPRGAAPTGKVANESS